MKKIAAIILCVALLSGCATVHKVIANLKGGLAKTEAVLCSPSLDQVNDAVKALAFFTAFPVASKGYEQAAGVFSFIRQGICVTIPQLQVALDAFDQVALVVEGQMALKSFQAVRVTVKVPDLKSLRAAAKK